MTLNIVHLSDIHFRHNIEENYDTIISAMLQDVERQTENSEKVILVLSGDIVHGGDDRDSYLAFSKLIKQHLKRFEKGKFTVATVPGNHDVERSIILAKKVDHEGIKGQALLEATFNDYMTAPNDVFRAKFSHYAEFERELSDYPCIGAGIGGNGHEIGGVGFYLLNSAVLSSGGLEKTEGGISPDKGKLAVTTRELVKWRKSCPCKTAVLILHHPFDFLSHWARQELTQIVQNDFSLVLCGHSHDQELKSYVRNASGTLVATAPPLFTSKPDLLGYTNIQILSESGVSQVQYRQWTRTRRFGPGIDFTDSDDGVVRIETHDNISPQGEYVSALNKHYQDDFNEALEAFDDNHVVWVEPRVATTSENDANISNAKFMSIDQLLTSGESMYIKAPPQFGLTCLSFHLALQSLKKGRRLLRIDCNETGCSLEDLSKAAKKLMPSTPKTLDDFDGVVLDSWSRGNKLASKYIKNLCALLPNKQILVMETLECFDRGSIPAVESDGRTFAHYFMWTLSRNNIRAVVACYNQHAQLGTDDSVLTRILDDMDRLNLHRTPLNCLTLLKASEAAFDENPVNRAEVIHRVLFILFNIGSLPTYKSRPDLKDCEYVLGYLCELLLRDRRNTFSREYFIRIITDFCDQMLVKIDAQVVFDVLYDNHIIVNCVDEFRFRFGYWMVYFAAHRMHHSEEFRKHVFESLRYANFPEIIEFYTGIDRKRGDAVDVLGNDLESLINYVDTKCGFPKEFNPFDMLRWEAREDVLAKMHDEIGAGVKASSLPDAVKDEFADRTYNPGRTYRQDVDEVLKGMSYVSFCNALSASATALRNSDYISPAAKERMMGLILNGWGQMSRVLLSIAPMLAQDGRAQYDGKSYYLCGDFGDSREARFNGVLSAIPFNIVYWFQQDLFSNKMSPVFFSALENARDAVSRHMIILLLISKRPVGWHTSVEQYIGSIQRRSFYLLDVYAALSREYEYGFCERRDLSHIEYLIKMAGLKHVHGIKKPGPKKVKKAPDAWVPERLIDNDTDDNTPTKE